jgi:hypothetical protein
MSLSGASIHQPMLSLHISWSSTLRSLVLMTDRISKMREPYLTRIFGVTPETYLKLMR